MDDFFVRALLAGIGVALLAGPLGCFIVWRRMAYFGDTIAHSGLLGVALGLVASINVMIAVVITALILSLLLAGLEQRRLFATDTLLGILSHAALSIGLVITSFLTWVKFDLMALLFGDILAVSRTDLVMIYGGVALGLVVLAWLWRPLLVVSIHEDIAQAEGIAVARIRFIFMLLIAFIVAVAMKVVGIVLITSLLIIPAAAARAFSKTPEQMAILAAVIGMISVVFGLGASLQFDTPSGPSIVLAATCAFLVSLMWHGIARGWRGKWFVRQ